MPIPEPALGEPGPGKLRGNPSQNVTVVAMKSRGAVSQPEHRHRARTAERPFLLEHDILKVTNVDNVDWEFKWDRRKYLVKAGGGVGFIPFPALVNKLGDPRSTEGMMTRFNTDDGQRGVIGTRYDSLASLFAHYGIANENVDELVDFAPKVEVRTMDTDEIVNFPSQDPNMLPWPVPDSPQPGRENTDTRRLVERLSAENDDARAEIAELRDMVRDRLGDQPAPVGRPDPRAGTPNVSGSAPPVDDFDPLAEALAGAPIDQGPTAQLG